MATPLTTFKDTLENFLSTVVDPFSGASLAEAKTLKDMTVDEGSVVVKLVFGYPVSSEFKQTLHQKIWHEFQALLGLRNLQIDVDWKVNQHSVQNNLKLIPGIKNIIAVASGKGGVGKSTTAINLALALQKEGACVGILDADVYGPSLPCMLGSQEKPALDTQNRLIPIKPYGLQAMSMGYLIEKEAPMVWRGPMVSRALEQMLGETAWENIDYLIVDLPPGTGDIQLTLAQKIPVTGAVIVTTPQEVALQDAKKALLMFQKLGISVLGVIENMGLHVCSSCGHEEHIFGVGGGEKMAKQYGLPLLGQLPLDAQIQAQADSGKPSVIFESSGKIADLYTEIARRVTAKLSLLPRNYSVHSRVLES